MVRGTHVAAVDIHRCDVGPGGSVVQDPRRKVETGRCRTILCLLRRLDNYKVLAVLAVSYSGSAGADLARDDQPLPVGDGTTVRGLGEVHFFEDEGVEAVGRKQSAKLGLIEEVNELPSGIPPGI